MRFGAAQIMTFKVFSAWLWYSPRIIWNGCFAICGSCGSWWDRFVAYITV